MGKPFSTAERDALLAKLETVGLRLFAEQGLRGVSIRTLCAQSGISQGGFYTFFDSKESFCLALVHRRVREKLQLYWEARASTLPDPREALTSIFIREGLHLRENLAFSNRASDTLALFSGAGEERLSQIRALYTQTLQDLCRYWSLAGRPYACDPDALSCALRGALVLFSNADLIGPGFEALYRAYCRAAVATFLFPTGDTDQKA